MNYYVSPQALTVENVTRLQQQLDSSDADKRILQKDVSDARKERAEANQNYLASQKREESHWQKALALREAAKKDAETISDHRGAARERDKTISDLREAAREHDKTISDLNASMEKLDLEVKQSKQKADQTSRIHQDIQ
jgi:chromosome segregation ATPase